MCVILVGRIGKKLHDQARTQNPDGFSLFTKAQGLIKAPNAVQVSKALHDFGIWHYRIRSSGKVDKNNIHPFPVAGGRAYLYHNGVLGSGKDDMSDTAALAETLMDANIETVKSVLRSLSQSQRFLLADAEDPRKYLIFGEWKVEGGVLMSHKMYSGSAYYGQTYAQRAGWESPPAGVTSYAKAANLVQYRNAVRGGTVKEDDLLD